MDVLIAGAGPTGLSLACGLLAQGVGVRLVDEAEGPAGSSRANILHARGVETLDRLDALADLPDRAVHALRITTYIGGRPVLVLRFGDAGFRTTGGALLISQAEVERILRDRLARLGGSIEWGTALRAAEQDDDGVTATLSDGSVVRSPWLVGCDGAHSATRKLAGIGFPGMPIADRWLIADVHASWDGADRAGTSSWLHHDGLAAALAMREVAGGRDDLWRMMLYLPGERRQDEELGHDEILERFRTLMPARSGISDMVIEDAVWTSDFQAHQRLVETYRRGRIVLAGDAAHIHSPLGGQGMLTGIGDAENLAWKLALVVLGRAESGLLDTYEAERRPLAKRILAGTGRNTKVATGEGRFARFLLERVIVPVARLASVQRWGTWQASQLWLTYVTGPLGGSRFGRGPRPGDRVPDRPCTRADGTETRLYAELRGRWALIGDARMPDRLREALDGLVVHLDTDAPDAALVRPDGHLAWRSAHGPAALEALANRMLGS